MLRNRLLILLGGCLLTASAALADDLGYVDCTTHPEDTQVFAKARKSQEVVGTVPCGERFRIVLYGFIFSEIQTADGKVGFVFSNIMTVERAGGTLKARAASDTAPKLSAASETTKVPAEPKPYFPAAQPRRSASDQAAKMGGATSLPEQPASAPASAPAPVSAAPAAPAATAQVSAQVTAPDTAAAPQPAQAPISASAALTPSAPAAQPASAPATLPDGSTVLKSVTADATAAPAQASATPADSAPPAPAPAPAAAPDAAVSVSTTDAPAPAVAPTPAEVQPAPAPVAQPQPEAAPAPEPPPIQNVKVKTQSWEKPNPGAKSIAMVELYGGFAFARTNSGGSPSNSNNLLGGMGSFGWNIRPWIQVVGDSSYNYVTVSGTKNVLYGNHYGARYYLRIPNPWHLTPFAEALVGGSRADTTVTGTGGYTTSQNCLSYKIGGGIDMRTSKLFEIRVIDFDYYRTAFGSNVHQSNYWVSTGIVLRLFAGKSIW